MTVKPVSKEQLKAVLQSFLVCTLNEIQNSFEIHVIYKFQDDHTEVSSLQRKVLLDLPVFN